QDKGRVAVVRAIGEAVRKTGNAVLTDTCAQKTAQRLGVATEAVRAEFRKIRAQQVSETDTKAPVAAAAPPARPSTQEFWLLKLLLLDDELLPAAVAQLDLNWVQHALVRQIVSLRLKTRPHPPSVTALLAALEDPAAGSL